MKKTQKKPYFAVIFTSKLSNKTEGYEEISNKMLELAKKQKGFIDIESLKEGKNGITVSYWESMADIRAWNTNERHNEAQKGGKETWYDKFTVRICEVMREYSFEK
ncbi:MAG: antibiotic biosynthesis monooxygenase [Flavobacteriaceae bacterium]|nr:antibiotic biosynthesis monooxygenase [Flavobacteriaceae bacterium]